MENKELTEILRNCSCFPDGTIRNNRGDIMGTMSPEIYKEIFHTECKFELVIKDNKYPKD